MWDRKRIRYTYLKQSKRVKNFLLSAKCREFLIFLFFFFIASGFWLLQTLNSDYEMDFTIPVHLKEVPDDVVLISQPSAELRLHVKDRGTVLLNYMFGKSFSPISLNFNEYKNKGKHIKISMSDLTRNFSTQLNATTQVLSIIPDTLDFIYAEGKSKRLPVQFRGTVSAGFQHYVSDTICSPDSVMAYASQEVLDTLKVAYTQYAELTDTADTIRTTMSLATVKGVKFVPNMVNMLFPVDIYTEKTIEIPICGIGFPVDKVLRTFPSTVQVTFQVGTKRFRAVSADDFAINIGYEDLLRCDSDKYALKLTSMPSGIKNVRLVPSEVDFLIEQVAGSGY